MKKIIALAIVTLCAANSAVADSINIGEQLSEGGVAIFVILGLSIIALAVSIERGMHLRKKFILPDGMMNDVKNYWAQKDFAGLQNYLNQQTSSFARIVQYMVNHRTQSRAFISSGVGDLASIEMRYHQQRAYPLAIVATVAPIVGLLGTVIGMIEAFHVIAYSEGMGNPALLAGGISKALINTASGLGVALPALAMHHFFKNRSVFLSLSLEKSVNELLDEWFLPKDQENIQPNLQVVGHAH